MKNFWWSSLLINNAEKVASSKEHTFTYFKTRVQKLYPFSDQNRQNWYPVCDQNGWKTLPFGAAHTYRAHIREYPSPHPRALTETDNAHPVYWFHGVLFPLGELLRRELTTTYPQITSYWSGRGVLLFSRWWKERTPDRRPKLEIWEIESYKIQIRK